MSDEIQKCLKCSTVDGRSYKVDITQSTSEMSPKQKLYVNWNVTKLKMLLKLQYHQNYNVTIICQDIIRIFTVRHWLPCFSFKSGRLVTPEVTPRYTDDLFIGNALLEFFKEWQTGVLMSAIHCLKWGHWFWSNRSIILSMENKVVKQLCLVRILEHT